MRRVRQSIPQKLSIYRLSQTQQRGFDKCYRMIVVAKSIDEAKQIHPSEEVGMPRQWCWKQPSASWCDSPDKVDVEFLGSSKPMKSGIILSTSYGIDYGDEFDDEEW